jgi:predicted dehydrogenase/nucleoside-diphosphate-sugar epimerase
MSTIKLGLIGCGTVAEHYHIPAALNASNVELTAIADSTVDRLSHVATLYQLDCFSTTTYERLSDKVDAVLVLLPNHLHHPVASYFLKHGIHVLSEKPLANTTEEATSLCNLAEAAGLVLAVGYMKRFEPNCDLMKRLIDEAFLGKLERFEFEQGGAGSWSPLSGYNLDRGRAGGGVLMTNGCHFLDRMLYWFGYPSSVRFHDDSHGGVEANCLAGFEFDSQLKGSVNLSKTHSLTNRFRLFGERGCVEIDNSEHITVTFLAAQYDYLKCEISAGSERQRLSDIDYFRLQIEDFAHAIQTRTPPRVSGKQGLLSVRLVEQCYEARMPLDESWVFGALPLRDATQTHRPHDTAKPAAAVLDRSLTLVSTGHRPPAIHNRIPSVRDRTTPVLDRVLITGGNGFVGSRLSEVLYLTGDFHARPMVHSVGKASYIARYPLEFVTGDLMSLESVRRTVEGCPYVVHLARGSNAVMLKGLENLLRASVDAKVRRFVHASSVAVYGDNPSPMAQFENAPTRKTGNDYGDLKLQQEEMVAYYGRRFGLPVVILRPPFIVGPRSHFVEALTRGLQAHRIPIVEGGSNVCNMVYVDNFIEAILLALDKDEAIGETFFVTDRERITWRRCLQDFAAMLGVDVPNASIDQLAAPIAPSSRDGMQQLMRIFLSQDSRAALMTLPVLGTVGRALHAGYGRLPLKQQNYIRSKVKPAAPRRRPSSGSPRYDATDYLISAQHRTVVHSSEKAQRLLGYTSSVNYATAMSLTQQWLQFTGIIPRTSDPVRRAVS